MDEKTIRKNLWTFPLGTVGRDMVYSLFTNFILTYVLFTHSLTPAQLGAITAIMVGARVFDALNDPVMGNIIDRTRTKWGKFKPWLVIGILTTSVVIYLAFNSTLQGWSFVWFFGIIYFMYSITYTMHDISYWGMVPSLGKDAHVRDQFTSRTNLFAGIGGTIAGFLIPMLTTGSNTIGGSTATAYGRIALAIAIIAPAFLCFTVFGCHEDRSYEQEPVPPFSFKKIIQVVFNNKQLCWIAVAFLLQQIGNDITIGGLGQTYIYFELGYEGGFYSNFSTFGLAATAILMLTYPVISKRIRRKPLMKLMLIVSAIGYALLFAIGAFMPSASASLKCWCLTIAYMIANLGNYCYYLIMMISILNTVEYNEYMFGERDDAIIASLRPFFTKLASALVVVITTGSYMIFGVIKYTNKISELEQAVSLGTMAEADKLTAISGVLSGVQYGQRLGLLACITILPFAFMAASYFVYKKNYTLDEDEYARICSEIEQRKAAK